ncbi:DUF6778 family protein [Roseovarius nanhaiticus]|uniref:Lipoprotein n=1 Tax=Roseovarius nanhaiticus TaxID=573024 RepID=A0A1N7GCT7_9RHOB|nr:DUF6778 family protein [Roseovarius nanhaiticus]SEK30692.1 hypothetical protein SAMN05216208_0229 [Roseovarius nanhaiticus]SIS10322.1 hypothetical protein SAMN05421666_1907 [Roseovarius nanhaiticus]
MSRFTTPIRIASALALAVGVSACASAPSQTVTRAAIVDTAQPAPTMALDIQSVRVSVPETLQVSEANSYYPGGDIVWRGEPMGDRHAQVKAIFDEAMARGTAEMSSGIPAVLDIQVTRFHALTQKARYSVGGVHDMTFIATLRDPATGAPLTPPRRIKADLKGYGGNAAIAAEQRGETQKVRITDHLAKVIRQELIQPGSYHAKDLGLMAMFTTK